VREPGRHGETADAWLTATAAAHPRYRAARREEQGPDLDRREVTMLCVTNRPNQLDHVVATYERQRHPARRLVLVTNSRGFDLDDVSARLAALGNVRTVDVDEDVSLGECLNIGLEMATSRYVAKIDDDDTYGPEYLGDLLIAHGYASAAIVGKHSYVARFEPDGTHVLRFPGKELCYTSTLAGGTLVIDREQVPTGVRFPDRTTGEDTGFLDACQRGGAAVFATDRFNYIQRRGTDNTWQASLQHFLRKGIVVDPTTPAGQVEV
jgi:glycosyltransferase involved in cell wall biosynthesis